MVNNVEIIKTMIYNSKLMNCSQKKNPVAIRKIGLKKLSSFIKNPILRCQGTSHLLETVLSKRESFCAQKLNRALKFQTSSVVIYHWTNLAMLIGDLWDKDVLFSDVARELSGTYRVSDKPDNKTFWMRLAIYIIFFYQNTLIFFKSYVPFL